MTKVTKGFAFSAMPVGLALVLLANLSAPSASAFDDRSGQLHMQKDCTGYTGAPGDHCKITASDLAEIPARSLVFYDQALGIPAGLLDSNVVLDAGGGNRAVGHCTLDLSTGHGLCTFADGTGNLAGFTARLNVSYLGGTSWALDGTYSFNALPQR